MNRNSNLSTGNITTSIMIAVLLMVPFVQSIAGNVDGFDPNDHFPSDRRTPSMNGDVNIEDMANTWIRGEHSSDTKGLLGSYLGNADINGDGHQDMYISAPGLIGVPGVSNSGRCYIWYGGPHVAVDEIDLMNDVPNITIRGSSLDAAIAGTIRTGDIDGDGYIDMVLGNPIQPESGKVFILWGSISGWPSVIDLYPARGAEPNGFPVGFLRTDQFVVISGQVTTNVLGTHLGEDIEINDLDNDGYDDVVISFHGWNAVMIVWGRSDRGSIGYDMTYIKEGTEVSKFGSQIELGDLDNDGTTDLIVSAPIQKDESRTIFQAGCVNVYFNIGRIKGNSSVGSGTYLRPKIWGKDAYDRLGTYLIVQDINADGRDDILIGVPGSDGPNNGRTNCGQIEVVNGANITAFPISILGEDSADVVIHGEDGKKGDMLGDQIGRMFDIGDVDGDGEMELVITNSNDAHGDIELTGSMSLYETRDTLKVPGGTSDLANVEARMTAWGNDTEDNLGNRVSLFDVNGDHVDDIIVSAPSADGDDNRRPGSGEVFIIIGNFLSITNMEITGEGFRNGKLYSGSGTVDIEIGMILNPSAENIKNITINIDPLGSNILFTYKNGMFTIENDPFDTITFDQDESGLVRTLNRATLSVVFNTNLLFSTSEEPDIIVTVGTNDDQMITRNFPSAFTNVRDIRLLGDLILGRNGEQTLSINDWFTAEDEIAFSGPVIVYSDGSEIPYTGSMTDISLYLDDIVIDTTGNTFDWTLNDDILSGSSSSYGIGIGFDDTKIPTGYPFGSFPYTGKRIPFDLKLDVTPPSNPTNIVTLPDNEASSPYDDDNEWTVRWDENIGSTLDISSSGVRSFETFVNGSEWKEARTTGGLWTTYYQGREMDIHVPDIEGVDGNIDHPTSEWGAFGPYPGSLNPNAFSIRWHGWFNSFDTREHIFSMIGEGEAKLMVKGETLIEWSHLSTTPTSNPYYLESGEIVEIIVLMKNNLGDGHGMVESGITLKLEDSRGVMLPIDDSQLSYPSNLTEMIVPSTGVFDIHVRSVDWVGLVSEGSTVSGFIDDVGPRFDLSSVSRWHPNTNATLRFTVFDPDMDAGFGSGVDLTTVEYRTRYRNEPTFSEWEQVDKFEDIIEGVDGPLSAKAILTLQLTSDWQGIIQFRADDIVGNSATSSLLDIGIDMKGPDFEILSPNIILVQEQGNIELILKVIDRPGSGADGSEVEMRYRSITGEWSVWFRMNASGVSEEIIATITMFFSADGYELQFRAVDDVGNIAISIPYEMKVKEMIVDMPPIPVIKTPFEDQEFMEGTPIILDSGGTQDDGQGRYQDLKYSWFSNRSGELGVGEKISIYLNGFGIHRITLYVDDGTPGHNISVFVNITLKEFHSSPVVSDPVNDTDGPDQLVTVLIVSIVTILILAIILIVLVLRYKKRREEEIKLDYRERTGDDGIYEDMLEKEEKAMGFHHDDRIRSKEEIERDREILYGDIES